MSADNLLETTCRKTVLRKKRILAAYITHETFDTVVNTIVALGKERRSCYVCVASVHMVMEAYWNPAFRTVLNQAAIATPDGKPVSVFMNAIYGTRQEQIAGHNLMIRTLARAEEEGASVYFYGATAEVLAEIRQKALRDYPALRIVGMHAPPFRPLTTAEDDAVVAEINDSGAQIVLVALGCPKQENWMAAHEGRIHAVMIGLGAAFPFYTGQLSRAPVWMQRLCLEWVYRMLREPRRLPLRYLTTNPPFLFLIFRQWLVRKCFGLRPEDALPKGCLRE